MVETLYLSEGSTIFDYFSVKDGIIEEIKKEIIRI